MRAVVFCDSLEARAKAWALRCHAVAPDAAFFVRPDDDRLLRYYPAEPLRLVHQALGEAPPDQFAAALHHYRDPSLSVAQGVQLEIWYGGHGAEPERQKEWNVWRKLPSAMDVIDGIDDGEIEELLGWIWASPTERAQLPVPVLLQRPEDEETLHALLILCEAYLATCIDPDTHAPDAKLCASAPNLADALRAACWTKFFADNPESPVAEELRLHGPREERQRYVMKAEEFWEIRRADELKANALKEWKDGSRDGLEKVTTLLQHIAEPGRVPPTAVAEAYLALRHRLGNTPC